MTVSAGATYDDFLAGAWNALVTSGGQILLPRHEVRLNAPGWADHWDQVLLLNTPGAATLYAFGRGEGRTPQELRAEIDRLAGGLSERGVLRGPPVRLVIILTYAHPLDPKEGRAVARLMPSHYFPGLRPSTWAVDLSSRRLYTPGRFGAPDGADLLRDVLQDGHGETVARTEVEAQGRRRATQTDAFYRLMQGRQPYVTYLLIAINVAVYLLLFGAGQPTDASLERFGAMVPSLVEHGEWWRLFTTMFLHASPTHILFNMASLFAVGTLAERFYGSVKFLAIYLGSGLVASLTSMVFWTLNGQSNVPAVGASGAIFGIVGALLTVRFQSSEVIPGSLRRRISSSMLAMVVLNFLVLSFIPHVDNSAHVGGLLAGIVLSLLLPLTRQVGTPA